jgi:fucose permease
MATMFLTIIYLAFISLGIPDSLLGSTWPEMRLDLGSPFGFAGILSMIVAGGTIVSSLLSGSLVQRVGTGKITLISCVLTAGALLGFSMAPSLIWLVFLAIPLGLGGGAIDAALNHYVAENYKAHHMNWLHCFWGVGATIGPIIMSYYIGEHNSWRDGYTAVSMIQFALAVILLAALPLWKRIAVLREAKIQDSEFPQNQVESERILSTGSSKSNLLQIKGVKHTLVAFLFYCGVESTVGLWGSSYLVGVKNMTAETAAIGISLYYGGITIGRLITGFLTLKVHNRILIRYGQILAITGGLMLFLPLPQMFMVGLIFIGLGFAPIYPGLLDETPERFGKGNSAKLMGYQMAVAYTGSTCLPPLFGLLATQTSIALFPFIVVAFILLMMMSAEKVNNILKNHKQIDNV